MACLRPQFKRDEITGALPKPMREIVPRDDQILAPMTVVSAMAETLAMIAAQPGVVIAKMMALIIAGIAVVAVTAAPAPRLGRTHRNNEKYGGQ